MTEQLNFKNYDQVLQDIITNLSQKEVGLTDLNPGSITRNLLEIDALGLDEVWYMLSRLLDSAFASTSWGEYLERVVRERTGINRDEGAKSIGVATAARSTPAPFGEMIMAGTVFETLDGSVQVITKSDVQFNAGATGVALDMEAVAVGKAGDLQEGTQLVQVGVAVSLIETVTVDAPGFTGGRDVETDRQLLARYYEAVANPPTSGNIAHYTQWAKEILGETAGVRVVPVWDGPTSVKLFLLDASKLPVTPEQVAGVQGYIDPEPRGQGHGKAPVGAFATCEAAPAVNIDITAAINLDPAYTPADVQISFEALLDLHLAEIAYSDDTTAKYNAISSILMDTPGVRDHSGLLINGGTANISVTPGAVAVRGMVTLT